MAAPAAIAEPKVINSEYIRDKFRITNYNALIGRY